MEKKIIKKIILVPNPDEEEVITKMEDIVYDILLLMTGENSQTLEFKCYESTTVYSLRELENFRGFLQSLLCSKNEVF